MKNVLWSLVVVLSLWVVNFAIADVLDESLVLRYMFQDNLVDSSVYGNHGEMSGYPQFVDGVNGGSALHFLSSGDYVDIPESPDLSLHTFTLAVWIQIPDNIPTGWRAILEHDRWGNNWYGLYKTASSNRFHFRWTEANSGDVADFVSTIEPDTWYHVVGTFDIGTKTAKMYLDGQLDHTVENTATPIPTDAPGRIGLNMDNGEAFPGIIDDLRIYDRVLTDAEIAEMAMATAVNHKRGLLDSAMPQSFMLSNYPNPFNPSTTIEFNLESPQSVELEVYNVAGEGIQTITRGQMTAGLQAVVWNGTDQLGNRVESGVYMLRLKAGERIETKKILLVK